MSSILVPIDYSLASHNAYQYALYLADKMGLDVLLAHYYSGSIDPRTTLYFGGDGTIQGSHEERMRQFAHPTAEGVDYPLIAPHVGITVTYETGVRISPASAIIRRARRADISIIVMPPHSSDTLLGRWLGSTAITVSEASDRPVYLVPSHALYRPFRRLVVANNHQLANPYPLWQLKGLAEMYGAKVHFVHIKKPDRCLPLKFEPWRSMENLTRAQPGTEYPFEVNTVEDKDVSQGLMDYAEDIEADLLVVINRTRSYWQAIAHATLTQDLALRSRLPILVLHTVEPKQAPLNSTYNAIHQA